MQILTPGLHQIYRFCLRFRGPQSEDKVTDKVTGFTEPFFCPRRPRCRHQKSIDRKYELLANLRKR